MIMNEHSMMEFIKKYREKNIDNQQISSMDLDEFFEIAKNLYGEENLEQYNSDKKLFKIMQDLAKKEIDINNYPDESGYMILKRYSDNILDVLNANKIKLDYKIKSVSFLDQDISIIGISNLVFEGNEVLIGVSRKLIDFIYTLSRIITEEIPLYRDNGEIGLEIALNEIPQFIIENRNLKEKFLELLQKSFLGAKNIDKRIYQIDKLNKLTTLFWGNAELFMIAHEYAHACYKHVEKKSESLSNEERRKEELDADNLALQIVLAHNIKTEKSVIPAYLGIGILFGSLEIINDIKGNDNGLIYHTAQVRMSYLEQFVKKHYDFNISEPWEFADYFFNVIKCLLSNTKELYKELEMYFPNKI